MYFLQQATGGGSIGFWIPVIIVYIIIFYFLFIRPKKIQERKMREKINQLKTGEDVITNGGIYGTISKVEEKFFYIKIAPQVDIKVLKEAVNPVLKDAINKQ